MLACLHSHNPAFSIHRQTRSFLSLHILFLFVEHHQLLSPMWLKADIQTQGHQL